MSAQLVKSLAARVFGTSAYREACDAFLVRLDAELTYMAHRILVAFCAGEAQFTPDPTAATFQRSGVLDDKDRRAFLDLFKRTEAAFTLCQFAPAFNRPMSRAALAFVDHMEQADRIASSRWFRVEEFLIDPEVRSRIGGEFPVEHVHMLGHMLGLLRAGDEVLARNDMVAAVIAILERQALDMAQRVVTGHRP